MAITIPAIRPADDSAHPADGLARAALRADGAVVLLGGASLLAGAGAVDTFLGLGSPATLATLGAIFLPYGAWLVRAAGRERVPRRLVAVVAGVNAAWVAASAALLLTGAPALTGGGRWAIVAAAAIVALLAGVQVVALRRLR